MPKDNKQFTVERTTNLGEVANKYPDAAKIMLEYGLHCVGCFANQFDTVEQGALIHGLSAEELDEMIFRVNESIKQHGILKE
jgi:hybrid cluster-associated redox disulfide protein